MKCIQSFIVKDTHGLHTRATSWIVKALKKAKSTVFFRYDSTCVNATSMLELLTLAAPCGAEIEVTAEGSDAATVMQILEQGFAGAFQP